MLMQMYTKQMDKHTALELACLYKNQLSQIFLAWFIMQQFLHLHLEKKLSSKSKAILPKEQMQDQEEYISAAPACISNCIS